MPFKIQRVARGLLDALAVSGGDGPRELEDRVSGVVDLTQFYGLTQLQTITQANAALAENGTVSVTTPTNVYTVLYGVSTVVVTTATMTMLHYSISIGPVATAISLQGWFYPRQSDTLGLFEVGVLRDGWTSPYPRILLPGTNVNFTLGILGTDATANCSVTAQIGILG